MVDLIFENSVNDMYETFVIQDDLAYPMFFHLIFAVYKINMYFNLDLFSIFYSNLNLLEVESVLVEYFLC